MHGPATSPVISLRQLAADVAAALIFSTRLPFPGAAAIAGADIARASWALPVAGAIVGLIAAAVYWLARAAGLPPLPAAALTIAAGVLATGCLHEDGLADAADSLGGGTRARKRGIMRGSRIGTYRGCGRVKALPPRTSAL